MKKLSSAKKAPRGATTGGKAAKPKEAALRPCDKAFNQETARLADKDEACDDGVK